MTAEGEKKIVPLTAAEPTDGEFPVLLLLDTEWVFISSLFFLENILARSSKFFYVLIHSPPARPLNPHQNSDTSSDASVSPERASPCASARPRP